MSSVQIPCWRRLSCLQANQGPLNPSASHPPSLSPGLHSFSLSDLSIFLSTLQLEAKTLSSFYTLLFFLFWRAGEKLTTNFCASEHTHTPNILECGGGGGGLILMSLGWITLVYFKACSLVLISRLLIIFTVVSCHPQLFPVDRPTGLWGPPDAGFNLEKFTGWEGPHGCKSPPSLLPHLLPKATSPS